MPEMRVLVPLDGSPLAESALGAIHALVTVASVKVRLISVIESVDGLTEIAQDKVQVRESNLISGYLANLTETLSAMPGVIAAESRFLAGDPIEMIADQVAEFQPDLLVISTHGRSGFNRWRMGSVADAVVRSGIANCLVVGPHARLRMPVRSVLVPLDGSNLSEAAMDLAQEYAKAFGATLHLLRVIDLPVTLGEHYQDASNDLQGYWSEYLEGWEKKVEAGIAVRTAVRLGGVAERLIDYVAGNEIDLVVMTSKGRGGIARSALGSVTGRMIGGPAPVLVVQSKA